MKVNRRVAGAMMCIVAFYGFTIFVLLEQRLICKSVLVSLVYFNKMCEPLSKTLKLKFQYL